MPIGNITQTMSTISPPPHRGVDVQTVFVNKQEDFQDHLADITIDELNTLKDQLNTRIGEINSTTTTMNGYADTALAEASTATTKAGEASTSASAALTSRNQASTFATNSSNSATKASQWADNNYNVEVETGKYSAKHWATEANNVIALKADTSYVNTQLGLKANTADLKEMGVGQTWQDVTGSRVSGTTYTNSTGKPITVLISGGTTSSPAYLGAVVNDVAVAVGGVITTSTSIFTNISFIVPSMATYKIQITGAVTVNYWSELR